MQKCLPQLVLHCSLQHFGAASFGAAMLITSYVSILSQEMIHNPQRQFAWNTVASFLASAAPHHKKYNHFKEESDTTFDLTPPFLETRQACGQAVSGQNTVGVLHSLKHCTSKLRLQFTKQIYQLKVHL